MGDKKEKHRFRNMWKALSMELREHKSSFMVYFVLRLLVIIVMILQIFNKNYENVFLCILTLLLLVIPSLVQVTMKIELPTTLEIIILVFIFAAEILGEIRELVDLLNRSEKMVFKLSPLFTAIVAFCFSMTIGVIWEFFEFGMDHILGFDMQKDTIIHTIRSVMLDPAGGNNVAEIGNITSVAVQGKDLGLGGYLDIGLIDTMKDLMVNFIGAVVFSVIGYFYVKNRGRGRMVGRFVPRKKKAERDFLKIVEAQDEKEQEQQEHEQEQQERPGKTDRTENSGVK